VSRASGTPFWFGPPARPLFGWAHEPAGGVRGAVVLCPPLGYEHVCTYWACRLLADRLASQGFAALRFDYDGTGDSFGEHDDPDRVDAWIRSVGEARAEAEAMAAGGPVGFVATRFGSLLAAAALDRAGPVDALVLWDPSSSGRAYLREVRMLQRVGLAVDDQPSSDGALEASGEVYPADTVTAMGELDLTRAAGPLADRTLALVRPDRPLAAKTRGHLERLGPIDWGEAAEQALLVDVPVQMTEVPTQTIDSIAAWLDDAMPVPAELSALAPRERQAAAVVATTPDGDPVVERATRLGPLGLFGLVTEPQPAFSEDRPPTILCLNNATAHHIGPNRLWVRLARRWAAAGLRVARIDISGIGDSPFRPGQAPQVSYAPEAVDDVADAARALEPDDPHHVVLVGLCSGAYAAVDAAAVFGVDGICALNPNLNYKPAELLDGTGDDRRATPATRSFVRRLAGHADLRERVVHRLPPLAWFALDRLHVHASPARALERLVDNGVDTLLVYGEDDDGLAQLHQRGGHLLRRLERRPGFRLEIVPGMDHALFIRRHREVVAELLYDHVLATFGSPAPTLARSPG
jgi:alpha-beta hydrolase superfamily lysophospholipase